jgi:hypothetical protein
LNAVVDFSAWLSYAPAMSETTKKSPGHDIFCTPENSAFVSKVPYQSLSETGQEIRLLKIHPDTGSGLVQCELLPAVSLVNAQKQYLALSYCAGSAKNTKPIQVNGETCNVFANLHHALTTVRRYWEAHADQQDLLLWVDQICINQFDLAERSHQVGFMRDIYQNAKQTLICLSTSETEGTGMRWLTEIRDMITLDSDTNTLRKWLLLKAKKKGIAKGWANFCDVITSTWWGRAWVFQEFIVSAQATFLYGRYAMSLWDFVNLASEVCFITKYAIGFRHSSTRVLRRQLEQSRCTRDDIHRSSINVFNMLFAKRQQRSCSDLKLLFLYTQNCESSDERDKVYSIIGLADPGYGLMPDYSPENDMGKLLVETTKKIITFEGSLEVLSYLPRWGFAHSNSRGHLPSWVVDWRDCTKMPNATTAIVGSLAEKKRKMGDFSRLSIVAGSTGASFLAAPHPQYPDIQTTTLQIWAVFLDADFQKNCGRLDDTVHPGKVRFQGSQNYTVASYFPVESDHELWLLCGAREPFLLSRYSYGYRMVMHVECIDIEGREGLKELADFTDEEGMVDERKITRRRITIF